MLYFDRLFTLYQAVINACKKKGPVDTLRILEIGVYKGGSSKFIASLAGRLLDENQIEQYAVDTFFWAFVAICLPGIDGTHLPKSGFSDTDFDDVRQYLGEYKFVKVIKGQIQDVLPNLDDNRFDLVHLDVDIYEPTLFALNNLEETISAGGIIIVDDYGFVTCPGVRKAVDQFLTKSNGRVSKFELMTAQCLLIRERQCTLPVILASVVQHVRVPDARTTVESRRAFRSRLKGAINAASICVASIFISRWMVRPGDDRS